MASIKDHRSKARMESRDVGSAKLESWSAAVVLDMLELQLLVPAGIESVGIARTGQ